MLALINVRERRAEIGILRALGTSTGSILRLFLSKAVLLVGLIGAGLGIAAGYFVAARMTSAGGRRGTVCRCRRFRLARLLWILVADSVADLIASWVPALLAASQDPAVVVVQ